MAVITISSFTRQPRSNFSGSTCTLRVWYSRDFVDSTGQSVAGGPDFYTQVSCTISSGVITVAGFNVYSTIDSQDPNPQTIQVFAQFYTNNNTKRRDQVFSENGTPTGWQVPSSLGASISYAQLVIYNQTSTIANPPLTFYTATETDNAITAAITNAALNQDYVIGDYASLTAAIAAMPATGATLVINQATTCTANLTVPAYVTLRFTHKGYVTVSNGITLTIVGPVEAQPTNIFRNAHASQGTISFLANKVITEGWGEWWGAGAGVAAGINAAALNAANVAFTTIGSGEIKLGPGTYDFNAEVILGAAAAFTTISMGGTSGLVGTKLNWTGATSGVGLHIKLGRYNYIHDLFINNAVSKGTTIGLEVDGVPGAGGQTFYAHFERVVVRGFHVNVQVGIDSDTTTADIMLFQDMSVESGDVGFKFQGLGGLTNLTFSNVTVYDNATYGVWILDTACQITWNGGTCGANAISFYNTGTSPVYLNGIRDEYDSVDWQFYVATSTQNSVVTRISNFVPSGVGVIVLNNPAITAYAGTMEISNSLFFHTGNRIIPFGTKTDSTVGAGSLLSLNMHDNIINENVALFQFNTTTNSSFDGMRYSLKNNEKISDAGLPTGHFIDEEGSIVWPGKLSQERLLQSTPTVNMNTATATTLFTNPTGRTCVITKVVVRNASTSLTTASYSFGWTSAAFNDVIANATHTELTGSTLQTILIPIAGQKLGPSAGTFKVLMNTLQGGAATASMDAYGYFAS